MCGAIPFAMAKGKLPLAALGGATGLAVDALTKRKKQPEPLPYSQSMTGA